MYDWAFRHWISHTESDFFILKMKPYEENMDISYPTADSKYGDEDDEEKSWSVSVTNLPNDVFEDEQTKVCRYFNKWCLV